MRKYKLLTVILFFAISSYSQTFITRELLPDTCNKDLFFRFQSSMFFKNNEYFTPYTAGYTWPGFYIKPMFEYYITPGTRIRLGYFFEYFFSRDSLWKKIPIFSIQQRISQNINLVFGNIYGTTNHRMEEAMLRFDRYMLKPVEYGIQLIYDFPNLQGDTWLNWERFIYFNSPFQEQIQFGHNNEIFLFNTPEMKIIFPFQLLIYHRGGHVTVPITILTVMDIAYGIRFDFRVFNRGNFSIESKLFSYKGLYVADTGSNYLPYKNGNAFNVRVKYTDKNFSLSFALWQSNKFIAPEGEYAIINISEIYPAYHEDNRSLLIGKIAKRFRIDQYVRGELNAGFYYDTNLKNLAYYYGLYFTINQPFYLGRLYPQKVKASDLNFHKKL